MLATIRKHRAYRRARKRLLRYTPRGRFFRRASRFSPYLAVEARGVVYIVSTADRNIGRGLFVKRGRKEHAELQVALESLSKAGVEDRRGVFVDVGAHIGTTVLPALIEHGFERALAFEPELVNYRLLSANIAVNDLERRARAYQLALSDGTGEATLDVSSLNAGAYWLNREDSSGGAHTERVRFARLDDVLAGESIAPRDVGLLWMDVEGHEGHVLAGARTLLEAGTPTVLEFSPRLLTRAGGADLLLNLVRTSFTHFHDLRTPAKNATPIAQLDTTAERYATSFTDLLLFRQTRTPK